MREFSPFHLHTPTPIEFGVGVAAQLGQRAATLGLRHALLVSDSGLAGSQVFHSAAAALSAAHIAVTPYTEVVLDPTAESVAQAAAAYRAASADGLVVVGGGSAMDTAKALGTLVAGGGDDISAYFLGAAGQVRPIPPLICLPTTAGTGAEATFIAVVTHGGQKKVVRDPRIAPALALVDPALTLSMPPVLTASTGMGALSHALEALTSTMANPICDALALDAVGRIGRWLPRAVEWGEDIAARTEMGLAALSAGIAFLTTRAHLGHAVGNSIGIHFHVPHGFACSAAMPALLAFLRPACPIALARIAMALGHDDASVAMAELMQQTGAPRLGELLGVTAADIPRLIAIVQTEERLIHLSRRYPDAVAWAEIFAASM